MTVYEIPKQYLKQNHHLVVVKVFLHCALSYFDSMPGVLPSFFRHIRWVPLMYHLLFEQECTASWMNAPAGFSYELTTLFGVCASVLHYAGCSSSSWDPKHQDLQQLGLCSLWSACWTTWSNSVPTADGQCFSEPYKKGLSRWCVLSLSRKNWTWGQSAGKYVFSPFVKPRNPLDYDLTVST